MAGVIQCQRIPADHLAADSLRNRRITVLIQPSYTRSAVITHKHIFCLDQAKLIGRIIRIADVPAVVFRINILSETGTVSVDLSALS